MTARRGLPLVSIALPVRNGAGTLVPVVESVLAQTHSRLELVISDNASTDATEEIGRGFARADSRVVYQRQDTNVGLLNNFVAAARRTTGDYVRWIGDGDSLEPEFLAQVLGVLGGEDRLALVTTQIVYVDSRGIETLETSYDPTAMGSPDPLERFARMLRLLTTDFSTIDPCYAVIRRDLALAERRNMLREDQIFAARLALAGRWGHVAAPLARRGRDEGTASGYARLLGVPGWQRHVRVALQCRELARWVSRSSLDPAQRREAHEEILRFYGRTWAVRAQRGATKLQRLARQPLRPAARVAP